jgi:hypothetical protein
VFAASAAVWAELQTISEPAALIDVPIDPALNPPSPADLSVLVTNQTAATPLQPSFYVPAVYFYALGVSLPITLAPVDRYKNAVTTPLANLGTMLQTAFDTGVIVEPESPVTFNGGSLVMGQAARRIAALSAHFITGPEPTITLTGQVTTLITGWLADQSSVDDFDTNFWGAEFANTTPTDTAASDYLTLILNIIAGGNSQFLQAIVNLPVSNIPELLAVTDVQWFQLFSQNPSYLPAFTLPGNLSRRSAAFIVYLRKLFEPTIATGTQNTVADSPIQTPGPPSEILQLFISNYPGTFSFTSLNSTSVETALNTAFPDDPVAQNWARYAVDTISALYGIVNSASIGPSLQISYMEALYARGFISVQDILNVSQTQFIAAMIGTVAYGSGGSVASSIWSAIVTNPPSAPTAPRSGFQPVNPGSLVNCIPPLYLSPLGPCQYLLEMLSISMASSTIMDLVSARRGPLSTLAITNPELEVQIPLIDLVLESLELMATTISVPGAVYETTLDAIVGLRKEKNIIDEGQDLLAAIPQHSTPSLSLSVSGAYPILESCFTSPDLPYSQKLDLCRSYLYRLCSTRFDTMRRFREDITEYFLSPSLAPTDFNKTLWRLPVEFNTALEFLEISLVEYNTFYSGNFPPAQVSTLFGIEYSETWDQTIVELPVFLNSTGLSYCEFLDLWRSQFIPFSRLANDRAGTGSDFPDCPPCCLESIIVNFDTGRDNSQLLMQFIFVIRLWRKLHSQCSFGHISFTLLADICEVLGVFLPSGAVNPDFIRQLASLLMLVQYFELPWGHDPKVTTVGAQRTKLLGLWPGSSGAPSQWALTILLNGVEEFAKRCYPCRQKESPCFKISSMDLNRLSYLVGFSTTNPWNTEPTSTIRFAEVLAKLCASEFSAGDIIFLFTNEKHIEGEDPFPIEERSESMELPLNWPEDNPHGIWELREKLLCVEICDEELQSWSWEKIMSTMEDLGNKNSIAIKNLGEHFFPETLERLGNAVSLDARRWTFPLASNETTPMMWHSEPCRPFHYERGKPEEVNDDTASASATVFAGELWIQLPLRDEDVSRKLRDCRQLRDTEIEAVQDLYFAPRAMIAPFSLIFSNFDQAISYLIQEPNEDKRFRYFQREFAVFYSRCRIIAKHIAHHVSLCCGCSRKDSCKCEKPNVELTWRILQSIIADENFTTDSWEDPSGAAPPTSSFQWDPNFSGNSFAALLGLVGTGLLGKYDVASNLTWTEMRGGVVAWGQSEDVWSTPVPTVIPSLSDPSPSTPDGLTLFKNGFILRHKNGEAIDSAQPFSVTWKGTLLVDCRGEYKFKACHPIFEHHPECQEERGEKWLVKLERGQKQLILLNNCCAGPEAPSSESLPVCLERGAYTVTIEFHQTLPGKDHCEDMKHFRSGFQLRYEGPDTKDFLETVPFCRLIQNWKTGNPLSLPSNDRDVQANITANSVIISPTAQQFLNLQYISTLRDIRRTYQRVFKATLLATRMCLSARKVECDWQSELGFMLDHPHHFRGTSYTLPTSGPATSSHVNFDFNFFPVNDPYSPPGNNPDARANPSGARQAALFDWWERLFDYTALRHRVKEQSCRHLWLLFEEAVQQVHLNYPSNQDQRTEQLLRHLGVDIDVSSLLLTYFATVMKQLNPADLVDERWPIRVWNADQYIRAIKRAFFTQHITKAVPSLWAADDPNAAINGQSGNENVVKFLQQSLLEGNDIPRDVKNLKEINNGLRFRARKALFAYLCGMSRVSLAPLGLTTSATSPQDLTGLLLQDVEVGIEEKSSRIEDAIHSTQMFVQRARIGLEPGWTHKLSDLWECRFTSFGIWTAFKRRHLYHENWLHWDEMQRLKKFESVKFFTKQLESGDLSIVERGHNFWWPDGISGPPNDLTQSQELVTLQLQYDVLANGQSLEGLSLMGQPMRDGRPTLLTALPEDLVGAGTGAGTGSGGTSSSTGNDVAVKSKTNSSGPALQDKKTASDTQATTVSQPVEIESGLASLSEIPLWITAAIRQGTQFIRVAAASQGPGTPYENGADASSACCDKCGQVHDPCMDEYYFWLEYSSAYRYEDVGGSSTGTVSQYIQDADIDTAAGAVVNATDPDSDWTVADKLPALLQWPSRPTVHLFWSRVHMGTLDPPRRSDQGILIEVPTNNGPTTATPILAFGGRIVDSMYFPVTNTVVEPGTDAGIFQYDITTDTATIVTAQPTPPNPTSSPLSPYPWFIHFSPGKPLFPVSGFEIALSIAGNYRSKCSWEKALKWSRVAFDPLNSDNTWMQCTNTGDTHTNVKVKVVPSGSDHNCSSGSSHAEVPTPGITPGEASEKRLEQPPIQSRDPPCCPCTPAKGPIAKGRAALMSFLRTLLEWADSLMSRNSFEHFQQGLVIYDFMHRVLGPTPVSVHAHDVLNPPMTIANFVASPPPLNPELMLFYREVADRRRLIHDSVNRRRLGTGLRRHEPAPWFSHRRWDSRLEHTMCEDDTKCFSCCQPYRYSTLQTKAIEWVNMVKSLGSSLLSAYEKGDNEQLATLREVQQRQILDLGLDVSKNQWRAADWDYQALDRSMELALTNLRYYQGLLQAGLNSGENGYVTNTGISLGSRAAAQVSDGIASAAAPEPDPYLGGAGAYGSPVSVLTTPGGVKLAQVATSAARILNGVADGANTLAGLLNTQGSWDRRSDEWKHQIDVITLEIQQVKRQILAAERRRAIALSELNTHQRQMEHSAEIVDFLRDKFTKQELYTFLQQETASLYKQSYNLALKAARDAQLAFRYERGDIHRDFLQEVHWDNLHEGLMAGERLEFALRAMDQSYMDLNCREYELTKNFSLRLHFPLAFLQLKSCGTCEVEIPEWMFDLDYPSHYMRRIKNITLSVPCVAGPYTGMHCRAQLVTSSIRYKPLLPGPEACCCSPQLKGHCDHDPFLIKRYNGTEAIAISDALDDDGLFELNFRDERYLPFEFCGAVSKWKIELPPENNAFDFDSLSDFIIKLNYTAREGGPELAKMKNGLVRDRVPGNGLRFFDIRHEFPDAWDVFSSWHDDDDHNGHKKKERRIEWDCKKTDSDHQPKRDFDLRFTRNMFPFLTCHRSVIIKRIHIFIETEEQCGDHIRINYIPERKHKCCDDDHGCKEIICRLNEKCCGGNKTNGGCKDGCGDSEGEEGWAKGCCEEKEKRCCCATLFHGILEEVCIGPLEMTIRERGRSPTGKLRLPHDLEGVYGAFLVCEYVAVEKQEKGICCGKENINLGYR